MRLSFGFFIIWVFRGKTVVLICNGFFIIFAYLKPKRMNDNQFIDRWNNYPETEPPEFVEEYLTLNSDGVEKVLEWYEGACFIHKIGGGYWVDRDSEDCKEILNVVKWKKIQFTST